MNVALRQGGQTPFLEEFEMTTQAETVAGRVGEYAAGMKDSAKQFKEDYLDGSWDRACDYIKENPAKSLLLAVGAGVVLGSLLRRR
jgi:ElaB/YqjD/DUF883 family membrane-anchored ribosome-binding protein